MQEFDKEKMEELMIEFLDGNLSGELKEYVEKYVAKDGEAQKQFEEIKRIHGAFDISPEFEPDPSTIIAFEKVLKEEMQKGIQSGEKKEAKVISMVWKWPARIAAAITILLVGYFLGTQFNGKDDELAQIRKEMEATRQLVMMALNNQSASQRIMGVNYTESIKQPDNQILDVLIKTMNEDENVNVRLAAVNALVNFSSEEKVKQALIKSLDIQTDPIIQIALIDAMVNLNEKRAVKKLEEMSKDENNIQAVQDQAYYGLYKLM